MSEDTIIVAIVFGSILGMIAIPMLFNLAKKWVDRNSSSLNEEKFDRLAKAFIKHKKETDRRLQNIEAIVTDDEPKTKTSSNRKLKKSKIHNPIEIEADEGKAKQKKPESNSGNLRNMLKE